jgi:hypothetical protein
VKVAASERAWFHKVAAAQGITLSDLVRHAITIEGARLGVPVPTASPAA